MRLNSALLFCLILIPFFGCRKAKEENINEIRIGVLGGSKYKTVKGLPTIIFKDLYIINLNNDSIFSIHFPTNDSPNRLFTEYRGIKKLSYDKIVVDFIKTSKERPSSRILELERAVGNCLDAHNKLMYFEFVQGSLKKQFVTTYNDCPPQFQELFEHIKKLPKSRIDADSITISKYNSRFITPIMSQIKVIIYKGTAMEVTN